MLLGGTASYQLINRVFENPHLFGTPHPPYLIALRVAWKYFLPSFDVLLSTRLLRINQNVVANINNICLKHPYALSFLLTRDLP